MTDTVASVPYIPEPPSVDVTSTVVEQLNSLGEPTLSSLGLCSYYPPGWVQSLLENIHLTTGLPWWGTLVTCKFITFCISRSIRNLIFNI